jgi:uncharacterized membrane protein
MNTFLVAAGVVIILDFIWLHLNLDAHKKLFAHVQGSPLRIRVIPAIAVYVLIPLAIAYFAVSGAKSLKDAGIRGALLGASMYGLYDLTNLSTLNGWTYVMTMKDILWGTTVCAAAAGAAFKFK